MDTQNLLFPKQPSKKKRMQHPKSILATQKGTCFFCKRQVPTEEHHIFGGPNRKNSEKYGLKVDLCPYCHRLSRFSVHNGGMLLHILHEVGQQAFEKEHTREEFIEIFGKNYRED